MSEFYLFYVNKKFKFILDEHQKIKEEYNNVIAENNANLNQNAIASGVPTGQKNQYINNNSNYEQVNNNWTNPNNNVYQQMNNFNNNNLQNNIPYPNQFNPNFQNQSAEITTINPIKSHENIVPQSNENPNSRVISRNHSRNVSINHDMNNIQNKNESNSSVNSFNNQNNNNNNIINNPIKPVINNNISNPVNNFNFEKVNNNNPSNQEGSSKMFDDNKFNNFSSPIPVANFTAFTFDNNINKDVINQNMNNSNTVSQTINNFDNPNNFKMNGNNNDQVNNFDKGYPTLDTEFKFDNETTNQNKISNDTVNINNQIKINSQMETNNNMNINNNENANNNDPSRRESDFDFDFNGYDKVETFKEIANKKGEDLFKNSNNNFESDWDF